MKKPIWVPPASRIKNANITRFINYVNERYGHNFSNYFELYDWSVASIPEFWMSLWDFLGIKASKRPLKAVEGLEKFPGIAWFPGAELNFAENLLKYRDNRDAFIFKCESKPSVRITYEELYAAVAGLAGSLRSMGVTRKDRVVAYMPNIMETAVAMLAATAVGATWASCGSELGTQAVLDRFSQIRPKVLFTVDGYLYRNKPFSLLSGVKAIVEAAPSIEKVIVVSCIQDKPDITGIPNAVLYGDFIRDASDLDFEQVPFDHPVYIMFSSGTTGKPKCMVQSTGGILLNQMKELVLHADLTREDKILYMTAPSWMMWNWLMASLAVGATVVLFDGHPGYPDWGTMWKLVEEEKITFFGTSATYLNTLKNQNFVPKHLFDLSSLKSMGQTGSPLSADGFEYVYRAIKDDLHFNSLAGGTDINGCFVMGCPTLPVYAGELQAPALGMKVKAYDDSGSPVYDIQGELVCEAPVPSMPLYFWDDPGNTRYTDAYFSFYPGVWRHGDYVQFFSDTKGVTFSGRSDAVLKPSGVRIGTAEIYNIVEKLPEVMDSVAVGQNWENDQRVLLFVKLMPGETLTEELKSRIKEALRDKASPRHVPAIILETPHIPYTFSLKKVESAVTNIINGRPVTNRDALMNPESLDYFEQILPEVKG